MVPAPGSQATSTALIHAYLFLLNLSQLDMHLLDPAVNFDALCSAVNESLPYGQGSLVSAHTCQLIHASNSQLTSFDNMTFCGFLTRNRSVPRSLAEPEYHPPKIR